MDLPSIRIYVRTYLDLEEEDMVDLLIDRWVREGVVRVVRATNRWPFYESTDTHQITTESYILPSIALEQISTVEADKQVGPLDYIDISQAEVHFFHSGTVLVGRPQRYSKWEGGIRIWPAPDDDYQLTIRGYRPIVHGLTIDLPEDYHEAVLEWVMHKALLHQDEVELAQIHRATFDDLLKTLIAEEKTGEGDFPLIFNGGPSPSRGRFQMWEPRGPGLGGWGT